MTYSPTLSTVDELFAAVERDTIDALVRKRQSSGELASDPALDQARKLLKELHRATRDVVLNGREKMEEAIASVEHMWDNIRDELGDKAVEFAERFQDQIWRLIQGALAHAANCFPKSLEGTWQNSLEAVSVTLSWSVSPSVQIAAADWLKIAADGGLSISATYRNGADT